MAKTSLVNTPDDDESYSVLRRPTSRSSSFSEDGITAKGPIISNPAVCDDKLPSASHRASRNEYLVTESATRAAGYYDRLDRLLDQLEFRVGNIEQRDRRPQPSDRIEIIRGKRHNGADDEGSVSDEDSDSEGGARSGKLITPTTLSEVRECDWEHFVNRFSPHEPTYAIETLVAGPKIGQDVADESERQGRLGGPRPPRALNDRRVHRIDANGCWIQRVRIQSKSLLSIFSKVTGYEWGTKPHTFVRPFQYLIYYHEKFKEELRRIELETDSTQEPHGCHGSGEVADQSEVRRHGANIPSTSIPDSGGEAQSQTAPADKDARTHEVQTNATALEDLRCYVKFVEEKLLPELSRYREASYSARLKIRFDDLWYLFRPGDLIFVPQKALESSTEEQIRHLGVPVENTSHETSMYQKIWRLHGGRVPAAEISPSVAGPSPAKSFTAYCYYLDYDGSSYGGVQRLFKIRYFEGEKDIRELDFYPLRFAQGADELLREAKHVGRMFTEYVSRWHLSYDGWTYVTDPIGIPILDLFNARERRQKRPEHIEGEVIVDFREAFNSNPSYKNHFIDDEVSTEQQSLSGIIDSPHHIVVWADSRRSDFISASPEAIVLNDDCEMREYNLVVEKDPYLRQSTWPKQAPEGEDLALLPRRLFVYSLHHRKFVPVDVRYLKPNLVQEDPIQHLQLPDDYKRMIQAAVNAHLRRQRIERGIESREGGDVRTQDFIYGKGRGLLVMLHGEPGVGKTATAEAVAHSTRRPLFPISCSDLATGWAVEERLEEIFRLAHLWDCILLLDEADVFLAARSLRDGSSTLVSMFLRKLEYYNGILFFTTNRIGKLDPALTSRIHLILHYKRLGLTETESIFRTNIKRLQQAEQQQHEASGEPPLFIMEQDILRFAADHYNKYPKGKGAWNGRQIRNAFTVAASLARHEVEQLGPVGCQPQLRYSHFQEVEKLTREYDRFRALVLGGDDSHRARLNEERDDDYEGDEEERARIGQAELMRILYAAQQALASTAKQAAGSRGNATS